MKPINRWYIFIALAVFIIDRVSKMWALHYLVNPIHVNDYFSFELLLNRGISLGLFYFENQIGFWLISALVMAILIGIMVWTWRIYKKGVPIIGQVFVIVGGISNVIDRFLYGGVIDFILLSYQNWQWPLFNIADVAIDVGVFILIIQSMRAK